MFRPYEIQLAILDVYHYEKMTKVDGQSKHKIQEKVLEIKFI